MQQVLFRLPIPFLSHWFPDGVPIYGFGMMLFLAFLLCTWVAGRRAEREGGVITRETIQDLAIWLFLGGLVGARVLSVLENKPASVAEFLWQLPQIWEGGIILYGSVLGALASYALAYLLIYRRQGVSTLKVVDILAPSIALGLCLGRIGCFLNGCCYGQVACADCAVYPVHFPLSAPARYALVDEGYQTSAGFTFDPLQPKLGVVVGQVEPDSPAFQAGLGPGAVITAVEGLPGPTIWSLVSAVGQSAGQPNSYLAGWTAQTVLTTDSLSAYIGSFSKWPRGKTDLTLTIKGQTEPITFTPRTIGLHPTQLYETISMLLLFLFLTAVYPFRPGDGFVCACLMICYGVHRYFNELLRSDPRPVRFESLSSLILVLAEVTARLGVSPSS